MGAIPDGIAEYRSIRHNGDDVATMLEVVGEALVVIFEEDSLARLRTVGTRGVRNAHPCKQEAEGDQKNYQMLRAKTADVATDHRLSE